MENEDIYIPEEQEEEYSFPDVQEEETSSDDQISELIDLIKGSEPTEEEIQKAEEEKQAEEQRQEEENEANNEYRDSVISNLELVHQALTLCQEDNQVIINDLNVLGTDQELLYKSLINIESRLDFLSVGLCINGFLLALGVGFLISKLIIERFK